MTGLHMLAATCTTCKGWGNKYAVNSEGVRNDPCPDCEGRGFTVPAVIVPMVTTDGQPADRYVDAHDIYLPNPDWVALNEPCAETCHHGIIWRQTSEHDAEPVGRCDCLEGRRTIPILRKPTLAEVQEEGALAPALVDSGYCCTVTAAPVVNILTRPVPPFPLVYIRTPTPVLYTAPGVARPITLPDGVEPGMWVAVPDQIERTP